MLTTYTSEKIHLQPYYIFMLLVDFFPQLYNGKVMKGIRKVLTHTLVICTELLGSKSVHKYSVHSTYGHKTWERK